MAYRINPFTGNPDYYDPASGGTVTSVSAGTGLTGGPITTSGSLDVDITKVPYYAGGPGPAGFVTWDGVSSWLIDTTSYVNKAGDTMTGALILSGDPTTALGAATKQYVDNISVGLNFHAPVVVATDAPLPAVTYSNGTGGVGATLTATSPGGLVIDTFSSFVGGERVLIKNQVSALENGIYTVTIPGNGSTAFQLTRATDADNSPAGELSYGDFCFVEQGFANGGLGYILNTTGTITVGVTSISYVTFNAAQVITAGTGLTELPTNTLNIDITTVPYYSGGFSAGFAKYDGTNWVFDNSTYLDTTTAASTYLTQANAALQYYPLSSNPAGYITSGSLSGLVPYTGATTNVNLGAFGLTTAGVNISSLTTGSVLFAGVSGALSQDNANFFWDNTNKRLTIGSTTTISGTSIWVNHAPGLQNYAIFSSGSSTYFNDASQLLLSINSAQKITLDYTSFLFQNNASTGVATRDYDFDTAVHVNYPTGIANSSVRFNLRGKQWVAGAIATQQEFQIFGPGYSFTSASTITTAYNLYVYPPTAGVNATITNNYAAGFGGNVYVQNGLIVGSTTSALTGTGIVYAQSGFYTNANCYIPGIFGYTNVLTLSSKLVGGTVTIGTTAGTDIVLTVATTSLTIKEAANIVLGTTTGTKIGTATNQRIGFFNATPIPQPASVTTAQGIADALTSLGFLAPGSVVSGGSGSAWTSVTTVAASATATANVYHLITADSVILTLPNPASSTSRVGVKAISSATTSIQVKTASVGITIDGTDRSTVGLFLYNQYDALTFISDGTNWFIES